MDLPRMAALNKYWKLVPPLAETVAAIAKCLGCSLSTGKQNGGGKQGSMQDLINEFGAAGGNVERKANG